MSGGYNPVVSGRFMPVQTLSQQPHFFFGGSQVPSAFGIMRGSGFHKGSESLTHEGDMDFTTKKGDEVYHRKGHNVKLAHTMPFGVGTGMNNKKREGSN